MNNASFNDEIVVNEIGWVGIVGVNPSHFGCSQEDIFRSLTLEKVVYVFLDFKIELLMGPQDEVLIALRLETTKDGRASEARMAGYVDLGRKIHK